MCLKPVPPKKEEEYQKIEDNPQFEVYSKDKPNYVEDDLHSSALYPFEKIIVTKESEKDVREFFKEEIEKAKEEQREEDLKAINKFFKKFEKLVEKEAIDGNPVVMDGIANKFCAIRDYYDLKKELVKLEKK